MPFLECITRSPNFAWNAGRNSQTVTVNKLRFEMGQHGADARCPLLDGVVRVCRECHHILSYTCVNV